MRFFGFVQADGVVYRQDSVDELSPSTGQPLNQTRFLIRRARLRVEAEYRFVAALVELDGNTVNGATARITNVEVSASGRRAIARACRYVMASLGLLRIPFGFEVQEKDYVRFFLERSNVARALFPGEFDLGARAAGRLALLPLPARGHERPSHRRAAIRRARSDRRQGLSRPARRRHRPRRAR